MEDRDTQTRYVVETSIDLSRKDGLWDVLTKEKDILSYEQIKYQ